MVTKGHHLYHQNGDVTGREHEMHQTWWMIVSRLMDLNGFDHENCWRLPWTSGLKPSKWFYRILPSDFETRPIKLANTIKHHQTASVKPGHGNLSFWRSHSRYGVHRSCWSWSAAILPPCQYFSISWGSGATESFPLATRGYGSHIPSLHWGSANSGDRQTEAT
jgi:hypothetical protein